MQIDQITIQNEKEKDQIKQFQQQILKKMECNDNWQQIMDQLLNSKMEQIITKGIQQKIKQELQLSAFLYQNENIPKQDKVNRFNQVDQIENEIDWISIFNKCSLKHQVKVNNLSQQLTKEIEKNMILANSIQQLNENYQQLQQNYFHQTQNCKQKNRIIIQLHMKIDTNNSLQQKLQESRFVVSKLKKLNQSLQYKSIFLNQALETNQNQNKQKLQSMSKLLNSFKSQLQNTKKEFHLTKASYDNLTKKHTKLLANEETLVLQLNTFNTKIKDVYFELNQVNKCLNLQKANQKNQMTSQFLNMANSQKQKNQPLQNIQTIQGQFCFKDIMLKIQSLKQNCIFLVNNIEQKQKNYCILQKTYQQATQKMEQTKILNQQLQLSINRTNLQITQSQTIIRQRQNCIQSLRLQLQLLKQQLKTFQNCHSKWISAEKVFTTNNEQNTEKLQSDSKLKISDFSPIKIIETQTHKHECFSQILIEQLIKNNNQLKIEQKTIIQEKQKLEQIIKEINQKNVKLEQKMSKIQKQAIIQTKNCKGYQASMNSSSQFQLRQIQYNSMLKNNSLVDKQNSFAFSNRQKENSIEKQVLSFKQNILNLNQIINYMMNYLKGYTIQGIRNKSWVMKQIEKEPKQDSKRLISKANMKIKFQNFQQIRKLCIKEESCKKLINTFEKVANFYINQL